MARRAERVDFEGSGGQRLAALLELPATPPRAYALFAHCFTCSKDIFAAARIAGGLAERGFAVLRFDFTGLGASEGEFANTNFSSNLGDLVAAADFLREHHAAPKLLIGHSLGGAAVLAAAARVPEATAVATIAAPAEPDHVRQLLGARAAEIEAAGEAEVSIGGRPFRIKRQFLEDIARHRLEDAIRDLRKALIIFHAPRDEIVGIENATRIFEAARHPKSFVSLDQADHLLRRREDAEFVAEVLAAWAQRYVGAAQGASLPAVEPSRPGEVVVAETREGRFSEAIAVGRHRLAADEPEAAGGNDRGPGPYDYLLAALGACTAMTLRLYAERKGLPLARTIVRLSHRKIHAEDCAECETKEGMLDRIERLIELEGPLDDAGRRRLLEIADKCPVHRTLTSEISIVTTLAPGGGAA
ncbi:MAG TPA: alpha/beta fold hydrolase [Alphaproteobacteria bacterium]|nr:alpha/beta fold hydrolase [Alphaproteobacteria bacterium]